MSLFLGREIERESPNVLDPELLAHFGLQDFFKNKQKKGGKPLTISFKEIITREKAVNVHEVHLSQEQKDALVQQ